MEKTENRKDGYLFSTMDLQAKISRSKIVQDISASDDMCYLLDPFVKDIVKIKEKRILRLYKRDEKKELIDSIILANFTYNPFESKRLYQTDLIWNYNVYVPPSWYESHFYSNGTDLIREMKTIPEMYRKFFDHLVNGDKDSYDYVLKWLANALKHRNYCVLTAIGSQGIGKGVLGEIMRGLFGKENFHQGDNRLMTKDFNKQFKNKRCVFVDEVQILKLDHVNKFKALVNDYIEVEGKGENAVEMRNYASIYIASNNFDSIRLTSDDRRFSIIELTDKKLYDTFEPDQIKDLLEEKNVNDLAKFLWSMDIDETEMLKIFTSKRTEEVRLAGVRDWEEWLFDDYAVDHAGEDIKLSVVGEAIEEEFGSKFRPSRKAMQELRKIYPDKFSVIRKLVNGKRIWYISFPERQK